MNLDEEKPIIGDEDNINLEESNWVDGWVGDQTIEIAKENIRDGWKEQSERYLNSRNRSENIIVRVVTLVELFFCILLNLCIFYIFFIPISFFHLFFSVISLLFLILILPNIIPINLLRLLPLFNPNLHLHLFPLCSQYIVFVGFLNVQVAQLQDFVVQLLCLWVFYLLF